MAVDFSLLPKESDEVIARPSRLLWSFVGTLIALAIALGILLLWPKDEPTNTLRFWLTLIAYPIGVSLLLVLRRFSHYEGRVLDVLLQREAARECNERIFAAAARPLLLLGSAYRFSAEPRENASSCVRSGAVSLKTRESVAPDGDPARARWIEVPGMSPDARISDSDRQFALARWLFSELLSDLQTGIRALPHGIDLQVRLQVSGELQRAAYEALWNECWAEKKLPRMRIAEQRAPAGISMIDSWLDQILAGNEQCARLIVAIQMHPVLSESPPSGSAEAGVALLLTPDVLASKLGTTARTRVHRPVRGTLDNPTPMVANALKWGGVTPAAVPSGWQAGFNAEQSGRVREASLHLGLEAPITDIDQTVGNAGAAVPWLAMACAADSLSGQAATQIVLTSEEDSMVAAVLHGTSDAESSQYSDETSEAR